MNLLEYIREMWANLIGLEKLGLIFALACLIAIVVLLAWLSSTGGK